MHYVTLADLLHRYNTFPSDEAQPNVEHFLEKLAELFVRNKAHNIFGIHLIHSHLQLPEKNILYGDETVPRCCWTTPTSIESLELDKMRGHTFILTETGFHPYEYHSGERPDMSQVDNNFLPELIDFLRTNKLNTAIALEFLDEPLPKTTMELVIGVRGTMRMEWSRLTNCTPFRQTGWAFAYQDGKPRVCQDGKQYHGTSPTGGHVIATTPRDLIETSLHALNLLEDVGIVIPSTV